MRYVYTGRPRAIFRRMNAPALTPKRRSHLTRRAMDKGVQITANDVGDIFEPLVRHAQLTTRQLVAFGRRHPIITKARLGELWHATEGQRSHWLHRVHEDVPLANHLFVEDLHRLGAEAEALLIAQGVIPSGEWVASSRIGGKSTAPSRVIRLAHDHMASDIALDIEIGARNSRAEYRSHVDILKDAPAPTLLRKKPLKIPVVVDAVDTFVEPDALFAVDGRNYALEADRGTESLKAVIVPKILAYREVVAARVIDEHLGIDNLTVLFATTSEQRMRHAMGELARIARDGRSTMFAFRAEPSFGDFLRTPSPTGRLAKAPWHRVGYDPLVLTT
jgi:hypothetical protein